MRNDLKLSKTAIILAGGKGKRIGINKAFLKFKDKKFIELITEQLSSNFDEIIISSNDNLYDFLPYKVVPDIEKGHGPLMGIYSALMESSNDINFITACDVPFLNLEFILSLLKCTVIYDIVVPIHEDGKYEPLFAVYNKNCLPVIKKYLEEGGKKIDGIFKKLNVNYYATYKFDWYHNVNTKADYENLLKNREERDC